MAYLKSGAWLLGLEGVALLRALAGDFDREFVEQRLGEVRDMVVRLDEPELAADTELGTVDTVTGYASWSDTYDGEDNPLIALEEPVVTDLIAALTPGRAVDAACGTGRYTRHLLDAGWQVIGVDTSPHMLAHARIRASQATLHEADLHQLPVDATSTDLVVCTLALTHQPSLQPAFKEFARVLRPGGMLITSDIHVLSLYLGGVATGLDEAGRPAQMPASRFFASDYITAARDAGFEVRSCHEPRWAKPGGGGPQAQSICPAATDAAYVDTPGAAIWQFEMVA